MTKCRSPRSLVLGIRNLLRFLVRMIFIRLTSDARKSVTGTTGMLCIRNVFMHFADADEINRLGRSRK